MSRDARAERLQRRPVILLVEDHEDTRAMYSEFLHVSFEVHAAADGNEALRIAAEYRPDVIVTDLALPGMDGFELARRLRGDPRFEATPIICLSGFTTGAHEERALAAGCTRVLQKPCLPDELSEAIGSVLQGPSARRVQG